jgi:hypothetical protein
MADEKRNEEIIVDSELSEKDLDKASGGVIHQAVHENRNRQENRIENKNNK